MSGWPHPVGKLVARDGCLTFGDRRFWSPDSAKFAGQWVSVPLPRPDDQMVTFWLGDDEKARKYAAHLIADTGFVLPSYAGKMMREARAAGEAQAASIVSLQADLLMQLLNDFHDDRRVGVLTRILRKTMRQIELLKQRLRKGGVGSGNGSADGDLERAERVQARLRLAQRIFELGKFGIGDHFKSPADGGDASEADGGAHRLCGGAK